VNETDQKPRNPRQVLLIILSIIGMLMSASLAGAAFAARARLVRFSETFGVSFQDTLTATNSSLTLIARSLDQVETSLDELQISMETLEDSVAGLSPLFTDLSRLVGTDMAGIAAEGEITLESAAESSRLIDSTLQLLAKIPFLRLNYVPEVPLHTTLAQLSTDVGALPAVLEDITTDLEQSAGNIEQLGKDIGALTAQTEGIKTSLSEAGPILEKYQTLLTQVQTDTDSFFSRLPGYANLAAAALVFFALWAFLNQLVRLLEGLNAINSGKIR